VRRAGEWVGSCFAGVLIFGYAALLLFGLVLWVVDFVFWDDPPSSTTSTVAAAAPTTVTTVASSTWTTASSTTAPSRTVRTVAPSDYSRHYRTGARCRDGWHSDATGSGACSWHGGVAEWLYADDRIVHETKSGRLLGTVKRVATYAGQELQRRTKHSLSFDQTTAACDDTFTQWKRLTDMREHDRDEFVLHCQVVF
jgi:hypothetical protein